MGSRKYPPLRDRIESKIDRSGGPTACHLWLGSHGGMGTPQITHGDRTIAVRRHLYIETHKALERNRLVVMICGNRDCLNMKHMTLRPVKDPVIRFWSCVDRTGECWVWTAYVNPAGYGQFMRTWRSVVQAHRYSWELAHGPVDDPAMFVCHHCDNPRCVRPEHLFLGTAKDNHDDMVRKGRHAHGPAFGERVKAGHAKRRARVADQHKRPDTEGA